MLNTFEETFEVTEMRTFKHEPFFIVGGGGGGLIRGTLRYIQYVVLKFVLRYRDYARFPVIILTRECSRTIAFAMQITCKRISVDVRVLSIESATTVLYA